MLRAYLLRDAFILTVVGGQGICVRSCRVVPTVFRLFTPTVVANAIYRAPHEYARASNERVTNFDR